MRDKLTGTKKIGFYTAVALGAMATLLNSSVVRAQAPSAIPSAPQGMPSPPMGGGMGGMPPLPPGMSEADKAKLMQMMSQQGGMPMPPTAANRAIAPNAAPIGATGTAAVVPAAHPEIPSLAPDGSASGSLKTAADAQEKWNPSATDSTLFGYSLLFTPLEIAAIDRAMAGKLNASANISNSNATVPVIPAKRVITVSGVYYRSDSNWTVWMNGKKVTPTSLLPEIFDIKVERDKVHLKWFDIGINNVISITLRPNQTYDIVTGVLLSGK